MSLREELVQRIAAGIKGFPQQPEEQDWDDLKKSLDNVQQRLVQIGEYVANNFYEALEFVPYTEDRLSYVGRIEMIMRDQALSEEEKEDMVGDVVVDYEGYLARAVLYLGWRVGWCQHANVFLLDEEVIEGACRRCGTCPVETPEIKWKSPTEVPPKMD